MEIKIKLTLTISTEKKILILRTMQTQDSKNLKVPIINGLTDLSHPCQIMSDIMTFEELKGSIKNKKISWLGDGNNVLYSLSNLTLFSSKS